MERIAPRRLSSGEFSRELSAYVESLRSEIEASVDGFAPDPDRVDRTLNDLQAFTETYLPHYVSYPPSATHRWLYENLPEAILGDRGARIALAAPRGEGKSTIGSLALVLWVICRQLRWFTILLSDTYEQAATLLGAVKAELEANPRLRTDFPDVVGVGRVWREAMIVTADGRKIQALGSGQRIRGLRHGPHRPDLIIGDDLESDQHVATLEQRRKLAAWWRRAVMYAGPPDGSLDVIVIGTVLHYDSLLAALLDSPAWSGRRFRSIMRWPDRMDLWDRFTEIANGAGGEPAARAFYEQHRGDMDAGAIVSWPEARPLVALMLQRAENATAFASEQQNEPSAGPDAPFTGQIQFWVMRPLDMVMLGAVDPSMGRAGAGRDPSAILVGGIERNSRGRRPLHVVEALIRRRTPSNIITDVIELQKRYKCVCWSVEAVQFQEYFREQLVTASSEAGVPVPALPVTPHVDKRLRIESLHPHVANGLILLGREQRVLFDQLEYWPYAAHDDGPDALHMLWLLGVSRMGEGVKGIRSQPRPDRAPIHWEQY